MQLFSFEIGVEGSIAGVVILQCDISVGRERTGKDGNISKYAFRWFIQNIGHLIVDQPRMPMWELTLYSKFCAATRGFRSARHAFPFIALISPQAPPMLEL